MQLNNQKGSLLILVMVISVIMAYIISHLYTSIEMSRKGQIKRSEIEIYHNFIYALKSQLEDPLSCYSLLGGRMVPGSVGGRTTNLTLNWQYQNSLTPFRIGVLIPNSNLEIEDIVILRTGDAIQMRDPLPTPIPSPLPPATFTPRIVRIVNGAATTPHRTIPIRIFVPVKDMFLNLEVDLTKPPRPPETVPPMVRDDLMIQILANVDNSGRIYNCFGHESFAAACQTKGGAFNHRGPSDLKCQPDINCFTGNPSVVSNPAQCASQGTAPYNYKAVTIGQAGGAPLYICNLCRNDL